MRIRTLSSTVQLADVLEGSPKRRACSQSSVVDEHLGASGIDERARAINSISLI